MRDSVGDASQKLKRKLCNLLYTKPKSLCPPVSLSNRLFRIRHNCHYASNEPMNHKIQTGSFSAALSTSSPRHLAEGRQGALAGDFFIYVT
jgi:hypothetical protein